MTVERRTAHHRKRPPPKNLESNGDHTAPRTQGKPNATREEKTNPGNRLKPERATTPPKMPTKAAGASDVMKTFAYGMLVLACWAQHKRQYPDKLIHKEIEEFNKHFSVCWYNMSEQEQDRFQKIADRIDAQKADEQVVNAKVDNSGQLTNGNRRPLRPTHTHKEAISKPNTETNAKDKTPTTTQP